MITYVWEIVLFRMVEEKREEPFKYCNSPLILSSIFLSIFPASIQNGWSDAYINIYIHSQICMWVVCADLHIAMKKILSLNLLVTKKKMSAIIFMTSYYKASLEIYRAVCKNGNEGRFLLHNLKTGTVRSSNRQSVWE